MSDLTGKCFCGQVEFKALTEPVFQLICHCTICQRVSGAEFMSLVGFPGFDTLQIVKGNELLTCIATSERMDRFFCSQCGSLVYHAFKVPGQEFNDAPAVLFENFDAVSPKLHVFYANRRRNHHDELPKFTALPDSQMLTNEGEEKK